MPTALESLVHVLPPPPTPISNSASQDDIVRGLGTSLPDDYLEFVHRYGMGTIDDFFVVFIPSAENEVFDLPRQCRRMANSFDTLRRDFSLPVPYVGFPAPGGLIPWGKTANGDVAFWRTGDPNPNRWPVLFLDRDKSAAYTFDGSMTEFLIGILSKNLRTDILPDDFPSPTPEFIPAAG